MPSFASGLTACTACASTCAVEWRRMREAVGRVDRDRLDDVGVGDRRGEVLELAVDAHGDNGSLSVRELEAVGHCEPLPLESKRTLQL